KAFVIRVDGTREELGIGSRLYAGDVLDTGRDGAIGVLLADETSLAMGSDGRMVLDEMIYDPGTQEGRMSVSVVKGIYTIVSGMVAKTDPNAMVVNTPVGSVGIRGTQLGLDIADGRNLNVVMMREEDGYVGEVFIRNEAGLQVMNQAHQVVFIGGFDRLPTFAPSVDDAGVVRMFHSTLSHLPKASGRENDYSAPDLRRAEGLESFTTEAGPARPAAPMETIRVVEGDYTAAKTYESAGVPAPEAPVVAPEPAPAPIAPRTDEVVVPAVNLGIGPNDEPVALDLKATTREDEPLAGKLTATDTIGDTLTFGLAGDGGPKHGSVKVNADGTFAYTPDPDFSGIDTFTYTVSDGLGGTAMATATVEVTAVPDVPELTVSAASGIEDSTIPIAISASVPGTEELASLIVSGIPKGARLSAGADNGDGTWTLAGSDLDQLAGLFLTPPADWSGAIELKVIATSTDGGIATAGFGVSVMPVPDLPMLSVAAVSGAEDSAIPLAVSATVAGNEEVASLKISGVPEGATLSAGTDNGDGTWTLSGHDLDALDSLTLTPPADWSGNMALSVTATSTDGGSAMASFGVWPICRC
ncbi:MAG: tandem-95 repeat protein, partial [Rhodospirillales bacterium]|nr:tandem-95 repeat protein [Rhodospirillales bacterium]